MADQTVVQTYPKATVTRVEVQNEQALALANGAKSSTITEDDTNWILTTVWPEI